MSSFFAKCPKHARKAHAQALGQGSRKFGASHIHSSPVLEREYGFGYGFRREKTCSDTFESVLILFSSPKTYKGFYNICPYLLLTH